MLDLWSQIYDDQYRWDILSVSISAKYSIPEYFDDFFFTSSKYSHHEYFTLHQKFKLWIFCKVLFLTVYCLHLALQGLSISLLLLLISKKTLRKTKWNIWLSSTPVAIILDLTFMKAMSALPWLVLCKTKKNLWWWDGKLQKLFLLGFLVLWTGII